MQMELWVLGEIIDEADKDESTTWNLFGIFFTKEEALRAYNNRITTPRPEKFFIVSIHAGELFFEDVINVPGFERMMSNA